MSRIRLLSVMLVVALVGSISSCDQSDALLHEVQERGFLVVGIDPTFPPFAWMEQSNHSGIDVLIAQAIGEDLGVGVHFQHVAYDGLYDSLLTKRVDILVSALVYAPEKTRDYIFSDSYFDSGQRLVYDSAREGSVDPGSIGSIAVELGSSGDLVARTWERRHRGIRVTRFGSSSEVVEAVVSGQFRGGLLDSVTAIEAAQRHGLSIGGDHYASEPLTVVARFGSGQLIDKVNLTIAHLKSSGAMDRIISDSIAALP